MTLCRNLGALHRPVGEETPSPATPWGTMNAQEADGGEDE